MPHAFVKTDLMLEMFKDETDLMARILKCARDNNIIDDFKEPVYSETRDQVEVEFASGGTEIRIVVVG